MAITNCILNFNQKIITALEKLQSTSVITLICRLWLAKIFFFSGLTKISTWDSTLYLFEALYQVPLLPANIAALMATAAELSAPVLLLFGLLTRYAAFVLLIMLCVIQFFVEAHDLHLYQMLLTGLLISYGPGKLSLDHLIQKKYNIAL